MTPPMITSQMTPVALGVSGQIRLCGQDVRVYTLDLDGELSRSVVLADQVEPLLAREPDRWLADETTLTCERDGVLTGTIELIPFFHPRPTATG